MEFLYNKQLYETSCDVPINSYIFIRNTTNTSGSNHTILQVTSKEESGVTTKLCVKGSYEIQLCQEANKKTQQSTKRLSK